MNKAKKPARATKDNLDAADVEYRYRVLGLQPLSVDLESSVLDPMTIRGTPCTVSIRSASEDPAMQRQVGGSMVSVEFASREPDMLVSTRHGLSLIEDFLSALALVTGSTFRATEPAQVARIANGSKVCEFLIFKRLPIEHWGPRITSDQLQQVGHILAHWGGLEDGRRLRRAALQYREAIGNRDDTAAFQEC